MANQVVYLILRGVVRQTLQQLGEVLLTVEVVPAFRRVVNVPGNLFQFPSPAAAINSSNRSIWSLSLIERAFSCN